MDSHLQPAAKISPATAKTMLSDGAEIAFVDVREHGQYGEGHPFFVVNCPFSRLELDIRSLVPNPACRLVLLDGGDGIAEKSAQRLRHLGYGDLHVVEGGAPAWAAAGYVLFKGVNVPSKAFGELVEEKLNTPSIPAEELKEMIERGDNIVVLDGRSPGEFNRMNIPTARSCPNGELAHRISEIAPDPQTKVIINCAGRTRSIIGAQTLINLDIPNPVMALRNGSQGWQLAGFELEYGSEPGQLPLPAASSRDTHAEKRTQLIAEYDIETIDRAALQGWLADPLRTTYLFDIRTLEEFGAGHLKGAVHAPGGQLVQATDHWVGVRNARIVLADDKSLRAVMVCNWLRLMGHDAYVLDCDVTAVAPDDLEAGFVSPAIAFDGAILSPAQLAISNPDSPDLIDVSTSADFRDEHVEGARWSIRPLLSTLDIEKNTAIAVMARDPNIAVLAAMELRELGYTGVSVVDGGLEDWRAAGLPVVSTPSDPSDAERIDFLFFVHDRHDGGLESARLYLKWEGELLGQMDSHERSTFARIDPHFAETVS